MALRCFSPDWILFVNDVWVCPNEVLRLLQHQDADMACGLDLYEPARRRRGRALRHAAVDSGGGRTDPFTRLQVLRQPSGISLDMQREAGHMQQPGEPGAWAGSSAHASRGSLPAAGGQPHAQLQARPAGRSLLEYDWNRYLYLFWDIWVARDPSGAKFGGGAPYMPHAPSAARAEAGLPFQVRRLAGRVRLAGGVRLAGAGGWLSE